MRRKITIEIITSLFVFLFVYAALAKLLDYEKFAVQLGQSPMLTHLAAHIAWLIPVVELLIAMFLLIPKTRLTGLYASFGLMTMFTTYIFIAFKFSAHVPCSCGGILESMGWAQHMIFNIAFMVLALGGILVYGKPETMTRKSVELLS